MIPARPATPPPPPPNGSPPHPCGGLLPSPPPVVRCGVVVGCFPPPYGVVWFGCGLWWFPAFPPCGVVWVGWFPPACLDLLGVFGKPMLMMILMMMMTIIMIISLTIILVFLWLVVGYLLPTCLLTIMALLTITDRGATIFVTVVFLVQLQQGCNGSAVTGIGPVREHGPRDCCLVCRSPLSEVSTVTWGAILVTVDGSGFGTLTGESCLKNVHCHTDRASWDAILVTVLGGGGGRRTGSYIYIYIQNGTL